LSSPDHLDFDFPKDTREIVSHVSIGKPQDVIAQAFQYPLSLAISLHLGPVVMAVQLEDEMGGRAIEVDDKSCQHVLPSKVKSGELVGPELAPEDLLFGGRALSESPRDRPFLP
jgi:hypothetical protein